ncbi:Type II secretion system protein F [subsurface metagenome]
MPKFACISVDSQGQKTETRHEAASIPEVSSFLRSRGLTPVSIKEVKEEIFSSQVVRELSSLLRTRRVKMSEVAIFFRQLATMLEAGVNLSECLDSLSSQTENKNFARLLRQTRQYVAWGRRFSEALSEYPRIFPPLVTEMIAVGEEAGLLDEVTSEVASYLEGQIDLKKKVVNASRYPMFISGFFLIVVGVMVFYLIPQFKQIFASYGAELPAISQFVINASDFFVRNLPYEIILVLGLGVLMLGYLRTAKGRGRLDRIKLKLPIVAKLIYYLVLARICRTLGLLLRSGVPLVAALDHTAAVAENVVAENAIREIRERIVEGSTLAKEMRKQSFFPPLVTGMVHTGERSGTLSDILPKVADFYDRELDYRIKALTSTLEPVLIIGLGVLVAFFVMTMYYPIFNLSTVMG